ncbi:M20/M25/M40 family metallo-hydrolase [Flavobacterium sp.]|uniref:M20/M25/M40 family metallo-hydrolase n=2 Tax=Flavobacterium sp. TaxID=239 RepID=UPI004047325F
MKFNKEIYLEQLNTLVAHNAVTGNVEGLTKNINFIESRLKELGFNLQFFGENSSTPIIYAVRKSNNKAKVGLYAHYDVEPTNEANWNTPSTALVALDDRIFGRGVADNLGIFLLRMEAIAQLNDDELPEIHWIYQGQEEIGSPLAHQLFPTLSIPKVDVWVEETGYFDLATLRQRFLTLQEDEKLSAFKILLSEDIKTFDFSTYTENRSLTKFDQCPFLSHIIKDQPYFAFGPNDEYSKIHEPNESLSLHLIEIAFNQFKTFLKFYTA